MALNERPTRSQAIARFLKVNTHADLASLYSLAMETQVIVKPDGGERITKDFKGRSYMAYSNGDEEWKPFRIPRNASTEPEYKDVEMTWNLSKHVEGIGMTGWDWQNRCSKWVAFDFDAITGHSATHAKVLAPDELAQIEQLVRNLPWVTLRLSTSGRGLHLYVFVDDIPTANHNEHAALARSILGHLSALVKFNLSSKVDACGGNMWVWHSKMLGTNGLTLLKQGESFQDIPPNWRDHVQVIKGHRRKVAIKNFIGNETEEDVFEQMTSAAPQYDLDDEHKKHIEWLQNNNEFFWWDHDRNMLCCHTYSLKMMHQELGLKGIFETIAQGTERGTDHNCFCYPLRNGAWVVRRFTAGVGEAPTWAQDGSGYTRCYYNRDPDFDTLAKSNGGKEKPAGGYVFDDSKRAQDTAIALGAEIDLPPNMMGRKAFVKQRTKDRKLIFEIDKLDGDNPEKLEGWIGEGKKWQRVFPVKSTAPIEPEVGNFDNLVRHLVTQSKDDAGWAICTNNGWAMEPLRHTQLAMAGQGYDTKEINNILGNGIMRNWTIVNLPFQPEYPGGRIWNKNATQLRFQPSPADKEPLAYPHWRMILTHLGEGLNEEILEHKWCKLHGIKTGYDYLRCWVSSLFQFPLEPLPYLFFYSPEQNTGKSIFHEALALLMTQGATVNAKSALLSQAGFNGELAYSILCYVEEVDLGGKNNQLANNRIKEWVTARDLQVHIKTKTPYSVPNSTHWVQCANNSAYCPIFPGDTRITMIPVFPIPEDAIIPKTALLDQLIKEAPDFLSAILRTEVPPSGDRLRIPIINTQVKEAVANRNRTDLDKFINDECYAVDGSMILFKDFRERFYEWVGLEESHIWTKHKVREALPTWVTYGTSYKNAQRYVANISFEPGNGEKKEKITVRDGKLFQKGVKI
jgi:hypothetical protein